MKICIYDLSARYEVKIYDSEKIEKPLVSYKLPPALIQGDDKHSNSKFFLFEPDNPDFSAFIDFDVDKGLIYKYNNTSLLTLTEIMYDLCFAVNYRNEIYDYFKGVKSLISAKIIEEKINVDETILLVPDALPLEGQEVLLSCFGRYKTRLLWHSMAIALGMEKALLRIAEKEKIAIVDEFSDIGTFCSKIEIKKEDGRAIPCHKIYKKANGIINTKWYMKDQEVTLTKHLVYNVKEDRLSASYRQFGSDKAITFDLCSLPKEKEIFPLKLPPLKIKNASLIISSKHSGEIYKEHGTMIISTDVATEAYAGALKFVDYVSRGEVPYYDECESFSVICQNNKEELYYFELVKESSYLPGGKKIDGNVIDTLFIPKGTNHADFYFHLGGIKDYEAQLKLYFQEFPIQGLLGENRRLRLTPSVIPGQGYAEIVIEDYDKVKLFSPISLDWKNMKPAINKKGKPITKRILEQELERTFPPDVPPVRSRYVTGTTDGMDWVLFRLVNKKDFSVKLNNSIWPHINDSSRGVDRFVRQNTFGSYVKKEGNTFRFPNAPGIKNEEYVEAIKLAAKGYLNGNADNLNCIAWSYLRYDLNGEMIPELTKVAKKVIGDLKTNPSFTCPAEHASFIANMTVTEKEFEEIFSRFQDVLILKGGKIGNWCRAMYQVLMYTPFIYSDNKKISDCANYCMKRLVGYLEHEAAKYAWKSVDNILRVMLYLLRRRVIDKKYYKKDFQPEEYKYVVEALEDVKKKAVKNPFIVKTIDSIKQYMDGKGTLDGIPAPL